MESYLTLTHYDLISPDGMITRILQRTETSITAQIDIHDISSAFVGFKIDREHLFFNVKSTLAQLGINGVCKEYLLDPKTYSAQLLVHLYSIGPLGKKLLPYIQEGAYVGKLFAADPRRRVRDPEYLLRMFGRSDREGQPLLSLGGMQGSQNLRLEKIDGYTIAFLNLKKGVITYDQTIESLLPTLGKALEYPQIKTRELLQLHQNWQEGASRKAEKDSLLLIKTTPLHVRTVFAKVVNEMLPKGLEHTTANVLQPDTKDSGDVYEIYGESEEEITQIPLEFYTLEPHREHIFFADRDQLRDLLEDPKAVFKAFETAPKEKNTRSAIFIVKHQQLLALTSYDWIQRTVQAEAFPGLADLKKQAQMVENYIKQQPSYPFLKAIEEGLITSQGVLFCQYFPSPLLKKMLLSTYVQNALKAIYFEHPSASHGDYFSHEDRSFLLDLSKCAILVYWADRVSGKILQFVPKFEKDAGMFVPIPSTEQFIKATSFGIYGAALLEPQYEQELLTLFEGLLEMRKTAHHHLLNKDTPIALITGGGPGVMELGNRVAKKVNILSCANIVDFSHVNIHEQEQNPYIDAKMTYRIDRLVERQAEFNLDFPIFLTGGFGTDFEFALERVRRKVGIGEITPILLLGPVDYWRGKITSNFLTNLQSGAISGSEWISNCFYCIQNASQGLKIYKNFFSSNLPIGPEAPFAKEGFVIVE